MRNRVLEKDKRVEDMVRLRPGDPISASATTSGAENRPDLGKRR